MGPRGTRFCAALCLIVFSGCARYKPEPLNPLDVQRKLQQASLNNLAAEFSSAGRAEPALDIAEGIGPDEAGLAALVLNPALKVKRLERGIAAGQLVAAGLYPNPSFDNKSLLGSQRPTGRKSIEGSFSMEVLRWQEQFANVQIKKANIEAVQYDILNEEWNTVGNARAAWWNAAAAQEKLRLNRDELDLSERLLESTRARIKHGAGTALDANLSNLQHLKLQLDRQKLEADADTAKRALRQAIGVSFDAEMKLRIPEKPFARHSNAWKLPDLIASLPESARMKSVEWRYQASEGELRAAIARQYPSLRLGPSGTFDFDGHWSSLLGFVATADVPLINRNQGEIKEKKAAREAAFMDYEAKLQAVQASVADAAMQVERIEQRLEFQEKELLPKSTESIQLTEKAYKAGDVAGSELLIARSLVIDAERSYLDLLIERRTALESLESVLGRRLEDISSLHRGAPLESKPAAEANR